MKRIQYLALTLSSSFLALSLAANPVAKNVAQTVASNFYTQNFNTASVNLTLAHQENTPDGQPAYYVFDINANDGFIIVAAEDAAHPILGYSDKGRYVTPKNNNNVAWWMNCRKQEIVAARTNKLTATSDIANEWSGYINNTVSKTMYKTVYGPLVQSTWDQSFPYNAYCPGGSVTGCVATCMAQIMRYWSYPSHGHGSSFYWDEQAYDYTDNNGYLAQDYDTASFVWTAAAMPLSPSGSSPEIAKLMLACGTSVNMDYTPSESGAWVIDGDFPVCAQNSFVKYFGYNPKTIQGLYQKNYTTAAWTTMIENEIIAKRPVEYVGWDSISPNNSAGHTWVCDGYNSSNNQFHMNWGWSGSDDGYFALNALNAGGYQFNWWNEALIGIEPPPTSPYFTASPTVGCSGMSVQFTDWSISDSNNPITSYNWSFPGGTPNTSPNANPTIVYNSPGTYNVIEIVSTAKGKDTLVRTAYISVASSATLPLAQTFQSSTFPPAGWVINNPNNYMYVWGLNDSTGGYGLSTHCMEFNNANDDGTWLNPPAKAGNDIVGQREQIYTPEYNFTNILKPRIYFDVAYEPYNGVYSDTLDIYYSTDCGATFTQVYSKGGMTLGTTGFTVESGGDTNGTGSFVPKSNTWRTDTIHIPAISNMSSVMFSFENRSGNGSPIYLDNINIPDNVTTSINQSPVVSGQWSVYPNPNNGQFTIQSTGFSGQWSVKIYNVLGQEVYSNHQIIKSSNYQIDLSTQPSGVYIYRVYSENGNPISTGRLVIE